MQNFAFQFDYIKGTKDIVVDWQSRLFMLAPITRSGSKREARVVTELDKKSLAVEPPESIMIREGTSRSSPSTEDNIEEDTLMMTQLDMSKTAHSDNRSGHFGSSRTTPCLIRSFKAMASPLSRLRSLSGNAQYAKRLGLEWKALWLPSPGI